MIGSKSRTNNKKPVLRIGCAWTKSPHQYGDHHPHRIPEQAGQQTQVRNEFMNIKSTFACPISVARRIRRRIFEILKVVLLLSCAIASASAAEPGPVTELMTKALANVPGKEVTMITVDYPPGATDPVHRH